MKKQELKQKIKDAFAEETPDLLARIEATCQNTAQSPDIQTAPEHPTPAARPFFSRPAVRRVVACALALLLFVSGFSVGHLLPLSGNTENRETETVVYLDVNPSIELQVDSEQQVVACLAANDDAQTVLSGLSLEGVDMNTALTAIVGSMYVNGYLSADANSILVSVDHADADESETLLNALARQINTVFARSGLECSIIAQNVKANEDLKKRAEENGVSVGKMLLVDKMVEGFDDLDEDDIADLADMTIRELNLMYSDRPDKEGEDPFDKDVTIGAVGGYIGRDDVLSMIVAGMTFDSEDVESYEIKTSFRHGEGARHMVYTVSIRLYNALCYEIESDCLTGEVLKTDVRPDFGGDRSPENER